MKPTNITANRNTSQVTINWEDGHESIYSFSLLRHACPCAECRGGHDKMGAEPDPIVFTLADEDTPATRMNQIVGVGSYAIGIEWSDGHNFGIYNWKYLRALCPCQECRPADL